MSRLDEALKHLGSGEPVLLVDEDRPQSAALVIAAEHATADVFRSFGPESDGAPVLWLGGSETMRSPGLDALDHDVFESSQSKDIVIDSNRIEHDVVRKPVPGFRHHALGVQPRRAAPQGVLERAGAAEAAIDALRLAGCRLAARLQTLALPGGLLADDDAASAFAASHGLPLFSIQDVLARRLASETIVESVASARLPSLHADMPLEVRAFRSLIDGSEHLALLHGPLGREPLVRLHSECLTGDALGSLRCDCGEQLRAGLRLVADHPDGGVVVYLRGQEGRGIGLVNKIRAYALQDQGRDTVEANVDLGFPADLRSYGVAMQILTTLGIASLKLLTNNPGKAKALERYGIRVTERVALRIASNPHNAAYLDTKRRKMGHDVLAPAEAAQALPV